ncbi:MAG: hypothetical protein K6B28_10715 [Lachnospiraceae bacterium]|nr:hypothetical protein [Lachnospiraceae bacterium]
MDNTEAIYNGYYRETDQEKRKKILNDIEEEINSLGSTDAVYELTFVKQLYDLRYHIKKKGIGQSDNFLFQCLNLPYMYRNALIPWFMLKKRLNEISVSLGLDKYLTYNDIEKKALNREFRNTAACYIKTCDNGSYKSLLGLVQSDEATRKKHMIADFYDMTTGFSRKFSAEEIMKPWNDAMKEELFLTSEEYRSMFENIN